jgi:2-dehydro-3-deoxyphosphooctonate aldolase (KDO 8-P synthase)
MRELAVAPGAVMGTDRPPVVIAGPCVIESEAHCQMMAAALKELAGAAGLPLVFKASFDKANRSSAQSYRGPGLGEGLRILAAVKRATGLPITSDIHEPSQAAPAAEVLDLLQVPAFLCRQTDLLAAAAATGKPVNVKKGQFLSPGEAANIVDKLTTFGAAGIALTERGTTFGYQNLVVDFRSIPILRGLGWPVVFDATHSVQRPGGRGTASGGDREFITTLARAAIAAGADGLFVEVHEEPERALSDGPNALPLDQAAALFRSIRSIAAAVGRPC